MIRLIKYGSSGYDREVQLRFAVLRKPLHLVFTAEQLAEEEKYIHIGYFEEEKLIACLMLVPEKSGRIKMKQVAVDPAFQGKGYGSQIVQFAEQYAKEKKYTLMYCHARDTAVSFYSKLGYTITGEPFTEVTIPHRIMEKHLS